MRLYVIEFPESNDGAGLTDSYHDGGGLVVVAESHEQIVGMALTHNAAVDGWPWDYGKRARIESIEELDVLLAHVVRVYSVADDEEPQFWLFPDAGCC